MKGLTATPCSIYMRANPRIQVTTYRNGKRVTR